MKIGLIAMSGVRALNPKLIAAGLTLPGFVERSKVIASLPSLSLLTLAGMTPGIAGVPLAPPGIAGVPPALPGIAGVPPALGSPGSPFEISYHEIADLDANPDLPGRFDLVAIASFTAQIRQAYSLADRYRVLGIPVVMGGLHVSSLPTEALGHCTSVVIGEAELLWPEVLRDFVNRQMKPIYRAAPGQYYDFANSPVPRFDLLEPAKYNRITVQTARGCPHRCEFCASSILLTPKYRVKPVERVIAEVRRIKEIWPNPFIEFADDNSFVQREHAKELLRALRHENVKWFTEADISIADDPELLELMRESGCRQVLIGLESPVAQGLGGIEMRRDWKLGKFADYIEAIAAIQSHGITVNGCFILGLDGHDRSIFDAVYEFVDRAGLFEVQVTVQTPFPGTPLYDRLKKEGRILREGAWERCTLFDVNYIPKNMTPRELEDGLVSLIQRLYDPPFIRNRRRRFFDNLRQRRAPYAWKQEAEFERTLQRSHAA